MNEEDAFGALLGKTRRPAEAPYPAPVPPPQPSLPREPAFRFWLLIVAGLALSAVWIYLCTQLLDQAFTRGWLDPAMSPGNIDLIANLLIFGGILIISAVFMRLTPVQPRPVLLRGLPAFFIGLLLGTFGMLVALLQSWVGNHAVANPDPTGIAAGALIVATLVTLFAAGVEEFALRGWLQQRLIPRIGEPAAVTLAAVAFSALHLSGGARSVLALANIFLAGLLFGLLLLRTGNLWCSIGAHFAWNWSEVELFGLDPNPGSPPHGSIFDFELVGAAIWGGSGEGMNVAVPVTIALTALILPLLAMREPRTADLPATAA